MTVILGHSVASLITFLILYLILYLIYRRFSRISVAHVPGPKPDSFLLGNLHGLFREQAGETEFKWQAVYGDVVKFKGAFGEDRLLISDPKALQYIYQSSGYRFRKEPSRREISRLVSGKGVTWADGDAHKRQRKIMQPAFGALETKAFVPLFTNYASQVSGKWRDMISMESNETAIINIPRWISRATLDAIGEAAFNYRFGAMDNDENPLRKAYNNLFAGLFGSPTKATIFSQELMQYIPTPVVAFLVDYLPSARLDHPRKTGILANEVAKVLVDTKADDLLNDKGSRDLMSLLVKANNSENDFKKMSEGEMLAQMRTIMLAGHETTANQLSWTLLELALHLDIQDKLRHEIRTVEEAIESRGQTDFTAMDFEAMPYLTAVIKESLRYHPVAYFTWRQAMNDDVLPLSTPIVTNSGKVITELPVPKGMKVMSSINAYNRPIHFSTSCNFLSNDKVFYRNKAVFGEDSHVFNPARWLNGKLKTTASIGVYGNLMSFSAGVRSCIGWRFAVVELQAFLVELVNNFEFLPSPATNKLRREPCIVMIPTIEDEEEKGAQLPLIVKHALREG